VACGEAARTAAPEAVLDVGSWGERAMEVGREGGAAEMVAVPMADTLLGLERSVMLD